MTRGAAGSLGENAGVDKEWRGEEEVVHHGHKHQTHASSGFDRSDFALINSLVCLFVDTLPLSFCVHKPRALGLF